MLIVVGAALTGGVLAKAPTPNIPHVTYEEVEACVADLFERYDAHGNDQISRAEVLAFYEAELGVRAYAGLTARTSGRTKEMKPRFIRRPATRQYPVANISRNYGGLTWQTLGKNASW